MCERQYSRGRLPARDAGLRAGKRQARAMPARSCPTLTMDESRLYIGCAGWGLNSAVAERFPGEGSHLERYARILPAVEINSSFYRPHKPETYARWRDGTPPGFRFSVKLPRAITHEGRLVAYREPLERFAGEVAHLGSKLGCLLVQLPPSMPFDAGAADAFLADLRARLDVPTVCEPRHAGWFGEEASALLARHGVVRVVADPPAVPHAPLPRPAPTVYFRLHGSPHVYHSRYDDELLARVAGECRRHLAAGRRVWCIFDNTASGAAQPNALRLAEMCADTSGT